MTELERVNLFYTHMKGILDADLLQLADYCETMAELQVVLTMQLLRKMSWLKP